jgi:hypothetical protein
MLFLVKKKILIFIGKSHTHKKIILKTKSKQKQTRKCRPTYDHDHRTTKKKFHIYMLEFIK